MPDPTLAHTIDGGIARAKAGKRVTRIQGAMLVEHLELTSKHLDTALKACERLRRDVEVSEEFVMRIIAEYNAMGTMLSRLLNVKVAGAQSKVGDTVGFAWVAIDTATGAVLTQGQPTVAECYGAVLEIRLKQKKENVQNA